MTLYGLHAHDLDPRRATGIARYATGMAEAMQPLLRAGEAAALVTAEGCGTTSAPHHVIPRRRRGLYLQWLITGRPLIESLVPGLDLLHVTAPIVPIRTRRPLVSSVHDITPITHPEWYSRTAVMNFRLSLRWIKRRSTAILAPTEFVAEQLHTEAGIARSRLVVTGMGFDAERFPSDGRGPGFELEPQSYVLYIGALSTRKNVTSLIEALPATDQLLVLAGPDGQGAELVKAAAARAGRRVRVLGRVADSELGPLIRNARALVHPSSFEGFGLTVLEAMSCGTPVIVAATGSLPEVVGKGGLVVGSNDARGWAEALEVLSDGAELSRLSDAGLARAQSWTWSGAAETTLRVYREAVR